MKTHIIISLLLLGMGSAAQNVVNMKSRVEGSSTIVEGEVVEQRSFRGDDGLIYTENLIVVHRLFKGSLRSNNVKVITIGGQIGAESLDPSHRLRLKLGRYGLFFLKPNEFPTDTEFGTDTVFEVFSGRFGCFNIFQEDGVWQARIPGSTYLDLERQIFEPLEGELKSEPIKYLPSPFDQEEPINERQGENCIEFKFEIEAPDVNNPLLMNVIVSVRVTEEAKLISKPVVVAKYNSDIMGENIVQSGTLTLEDIGISSDVNYAALAEDLAPD